MSHKITAIDNPEAGIPMFGCIFEDAAYLNWMSYVDSKKM